MARETSWSVGDFALADGHPVRTRIFVMVFIQGTL